MTIQEFIKVAIKRVPIVDLKYYKPYFEHMHCRWCIYNGYACKHPKGANVCIDYRVERKHLEFKPVGEHEKVL